MKKLITFLLVCLMAVSFCACAKKSHDEPTDINIAENLYKVSVDINIAENEISDMLLFNKISNQINYEYLSTVFAEPELSKQYENVVLPEDEAEVEASLLESKLVAQKCKEYGVHLTTEDTTKTALGEYDLLKQDTSQARYYNAILSVLNKNSITEADYLKIIEKQAYYKYNSVSLKRYFAEKIFDASKGTTLDEQYDYYINKLVDEYLR